MKKTCLLLILFFTITLCSYGQRKAVITLHDGTIVEGFAKIRGTHKIKFWETLESTPNDDYNEWNVKEMQLYHPEKETYDIYEYKKNLFNGGIVLLKQYITGNVSIYYVVSTGTTYHADGFSGNFYDRVNIYYISKSSKNNNVALMRKHNPKKKSFARAYATYIGDCPMILEKLKNKEFDSWEDVFKQYNANCSN